MYQPKDPVESLDEAIIRVIKGVGCPTLKFIIEALPDQEPVDITLAIQWWINTGQITSERRDGVDHYQIKKGSKHD